MKLPAFLFFFGVSVLPLTTNAQTSITTHTYKIPEFFPDNEEIKKSVANIKDLISGNGAVIYKLKTEETGKQLYHTWGTEKNILVLADKIEFTKRNETARFSFVHIINSFSFSDNYGKIRIYIGDFSLNIKGKEAGLKLKNELEYLKEKNRDLFYENRKSQLALFEKSAAEYRALKVKPPVSEELRKYIVQANAFNEKKKYNEAIRVYEQAIALDQTAYPAAYSNLALLSAQVKRYDNAIYNMKKYLLLVPEASDARGAQDKIYEWEAEIAR